MMLTIALFALFAIALGAGVVSLADTVIRGRNAYLAMKGTQGARPVAIVTRTNHPVRRTPAVQQAVPLKFAA